MRALLDTHTFLWWGANDPRLSLHARDILADTSNTLYLSAVVAWEIAIKVQIGKLQIPEAPEPYVTSRLVLNGFVEMPITILHAAHVYALPLHHRDPFDRILIAQSQVENMPILSADPLLSQYPVDIIW